MWTSSQYIYIYEPAFTFTLFFLISVKERILCNSSLSEATFIWSRIHYNLIGQNYNMLLFCNHGYKKQVKPLRSCSWNGLAYNVALYLEEYMHWLYWCHHSPCTTYSTTVLYSVPYSKDLWQVWCRNYLTISLPPPYLSSKLMHSWTHTVSHWAEFTQTHHGAGG